MARPMLPSARVAGSGCLAVLDDAEPQGLAATYWFDPPTSGGPCSLAVTFAGIRIGVTGRPEARDRFERIERVDGIPPGSGPVAVTARVPGINAGTWRITANPFLHTDGDSGTGRAPSTRRLPRQVLTSTTRLALLDYGPGVRLASWPALVGLGVVVALIVQAILLARTNIDAPAAIVLSLVACVVGYLGAKIWYLVVHRKHPRAFFTAGACIQGFLVGGVGTLAIGVAALRLPVGPMLDATTPGLFLGLAIGRPGCWLTGCCAGRPTGSRWALWSSDRRLGIRRFPVQLVEAALALAIGIAALALQLSGQPHVSGSLFIGGVATYTLGRQFLFPLRNESHTRRGRALTAIICALVLTTVLVAAIFG